MKAAYPVIFTDVDTNILVEVPDLGILTEANEEGKEKGTISDAIEMARDAIGLACINLQDENKPVPEPTAIADLRKMEKELYHWLMWILQHTEGWLITKWSAET